MTSLKNIFLNMFLIVVIIFTIGITLGIFYTPIGQSAHTYVTNNPSLTVVKSVAYDPVKLLLTIFVANSLVASGLILISFLKKWIIHAKYLIYFIFIYQMTIISLFIGYVYHIIGPSMILASIVPHGIVEIPAIMLAAAYGVYLCETPENKKTIAFKYIFWILTPLFIAAVLETFLTPLVMSYV